jgi:hypothetical protein
MTETKPAWELVRLLPNLLLQSSEDPVWADDTYQTGRQTLSLRSRWAAIVPYDDPRLLEFLDAHPTGKRLVHSFRNPYGHPVMPAALMIHSAAPIPRRTDAIAAYRNAVAACFTLRGHAAALTGSPSAGTAAWSDLFDFHPAEVDKLDKIQIHSAALLHMMGKPATILFAPSPYIDTTLNLYFCDHKLSRYLSVAWDVVYVRGKHRNTLRSVFRSLEIAFHASAIPLKNVGSLYDFGLTISLWVAALEALLWPVNKNSRQELSLEYLANTELGDGRLNAKRFVVRFGTRALRVNYLQKACALLYRARNAFLHGDAFAASSLQPWVGRPDANLIHVAPIVFREALIRRLQAFFPRKPTKEDTDLDPETIAGWFTDNGL